MKNPVRILNLMMIAIRAINTIKKVGGEEGFKFFLNLVGLQQTETLAPAKLVAPQPVKSEVVPVIPVLAPIPARPAPQPETAPARIPQGIQPRSKPASAFAPTNGVFAAKLNGAAKELGFEDRSVLGRFRKVLSDLSGKGLDYWNLCREVLEDALRGADLTEFDWNLSVEKMKKNLFFTGGKAALFIERCPKEKLAHLLLDQDGLVGLVAQIRVEECENKSSAYRIAFILDACVKVGQEAKTLRVNCLYAVNRMKQKGFIGPDHWLVTKVAAMSRSKIPDSKYAAPENIGTPAAEGPTTDADPTVSMSDKEPEGLTAPQTPSGSNGDKPERLDLAFETVFKQQMMTAAV